VKRIDALRTVADVAFDLPIIVTCAATSRELAAVADTPNHLYLLDSMGLTSSVGIGLALALDDTPHRQVLVLDGDGSLLMNLGSLATIGYHRPKKLILGILDNASYASTAGFGTYAEHIDLGAVAAACGIEVTAVDTEESLRSSLRTARERIGPQVIHIRIEPGNAENIPLLLMDPVVLTARFRSWLDSV
jgi:sulfopyruvate decarboxylase subunit beta